MSKQPEARKIRNPKANNLALSPLSVAVRWTLYLHFGWMSTDY